MTTKTSLITDQIIKRLGEAGIKAKKSLGQNFLVNIGIYQKIIESAAIEPNDIVVEVGPGLGILTDMLADKAGKVIAIEKDSQLVRYLHEHFGNNKNVTIINEDILKFNPSNYELRDTSYKVVGNIPYYLTSRLIRDIFERWPRPKFIIFMLQKEVAQRITASPPDMSLLGVSVQYYSKPKIISYVSRGSFYPMPKVDSAIVRLVSSTKSQELKIKGTNFFSIVRAGFAGKRKQLANNLARNLNLSKNIVESKLLSLGIDPRRRAETLTIEEWQKITEILF